MGDAPVLVEFNRAMARETEDRDLIPEVISAGVETLLKNPNLGFYVVAENNGNVVGSLMVTLEWSDWRNGAFWWIQSVYVRPDCRRQGIYRRLYQYVRSLAERDPKVCGFRLYVERGNTAAQKTYKALGMDETHYKLFEELKNEVKSADRLT
jgi:ribosomal protein S18 acetylase RimI-like enzyme